MSCSRSRRPPPPAASPRSSDHHRPLRAGFDREAVTAAALLALSGGQYGHGERGTATAAMPRNEHRPHPARPPTRTNPPGKPRWPGIQVSSNIATSKFAQRLAPEEQFSGARDSALVVRLGSSFHRSPVGDWPGRTNGSRCTPGQASDGRRIRGHAGELAAAVRRHRDDGVLLAPTLVREIQPGGVRTHRHQPEPIAGRPVRRSRPCCAADPSGRGGRRRTGERAQLANYALLGKTGRRSGSSAAATCGASTASFAALFRRTPPTRGDRQIDNPRAATMAASPPRR